MKKTLLSIMALAACMSMSAEPEKMGRLSNIKRITQTTGTRYECPKWSPDGDCIAFTELGYDGLFLINADGTDYRRVSDARGVGYMFQWSPDSREVLVRDTRWEKAGEMMERRHAAWSIDIDGNVERLTEDAEEMQPASWRCTPGGVQTIAAPGVKTIERRKYLMPQSASRPLEIKPAYEVSFITDSENLYSVDFDGNTRIIYQGAAFAPALSPDGTKVAFVTMYDEVMVMDLDGGNLRMVAKGYRPSWVNNSQIVYERTTDDGHTYTSGDLFMRRIDGGNEIQLTDTADRIEMNPCVSADGKKIAFTNFSDGQVYVGDLK